MFSSKMRFAQPGRDAKYCQMQGSRDHTQAKNLGDQAPTENKGSRYMCAYLWCFIFLRKNRNNVTELNKRGTSQHKYWSWQPAFVCTCLTDCANFSVDRVSSLQSWIQHLDCRILWHCAASRHCCGPRFIQQLCRDIIAAYRIHSPGS